jgi:hypothetical protein
MKTRIGRMIHAVTFTRVLKLHRLEIAFVTPVMTAYGIP